MRPSMRRFSGGWSFADTIGDCARITGKLEGIRVKGERACRAMRFKSAEGFACISLKNQADVVGRGERI